MMEKQISALEKYLTIAGKVIAGIAALYGGYKFIYGLGADNANKANNTAKVETTVNELKLSVDLLNVNMLEYGKIQLESTVKLDAYSLKQDQLTNSVKSLALKVTDSPLEFSRIMDGKTFEVVQEPTKSMEFPEVKMKITPIKK
jgi:hypothetical protein